MLIVAQDNENRKPNKATTTTNTQTHEQQRHIRLTTYLNCELQRNFHVNKLANNYPGCLERVQDQVQDYRLPGQRRQLDSRWYFIHRRSVLPIVPFDGTLFIAVYHDIGIEVRYSMNAINKQMFCLQTRLLEVMVRSGKHRELSVCCFFL